MPISKKPRSKVALKTSTKASAPAALPDRRAMESFLAAIAGRRGDDATAKAQDVMYEASSPASPLAPLVLRGRYFSRSSPPETAMAHHGDGRRGGAARDL